MDPVPPWATVATTRTALLVVHNTTTLNRMLDVVPALATDRRVQCLATSDLTDPFSDGLAGDVERLGLPAVPWEQALELTPDLVVSASHHGRIDELRGPLVIFAHGAGFGKLAPADGAPAPGDGAGDPADGAGEPAAGVFGLAPEWVVRGDGPRAAALALPHEDQVRLLGDQAPAALPAAVVVGDPCYDRLLASLDRRAEYRAALGADPGRPVVLVSSTWGPRSLLGSCPDLVAGLVDELPHARVVLVVHPNVWAWHGAFQLRSWFADSVDRGLVLVPPQAGWQAALVAADVVVGDHGSVTVYGAALGRPTLLAAFPDAEVAPGSAAARLGRTARRLDRGSALRAQVDKAVDGRQNTADVAGLVTSVPGGSAHRMAALFSRLARLDPPLAPAAARPYPAPERVTPRS